MSREWAMPSPDTFSIPPITRLLDKWLDGRTDVVDPFARNSTRAVWSNDLNPDTDAWSHREAGDFCQWLLGERGGVPFADAVLFDPPYSPRQIAEVYKGCGIPVTAQTTQNAALYKRVRDGLDALLQPGCIAISFGWNSSGFGKTRGYAIQEILLVAHGGAHNDTIVVVERKT